MQKKDDRETRHLYFRELAEWTGLEPATLGVTGRYSNQLNYHSSCINCQSVFGFSLQRMFALAVVGGVDGTRTRDPRRDRPIF